MSPGGQKHPEKFNLIKLLNQVLVKVTVLYICLCVPKDVDIRFIRFIPFGGDGTTNLLVRSQSQILKNQSDFVVFLNNSKTTDQIKFPISMTMTVYLSIYPIFILLSDFYYLPESIYPGKSLSELVDEFQLSHLTQAIDDLEDRIQGNFTFPYLTLSHSLSVCSISSKG